MLFHFFHHRETTDNSINKNKSFFNKNRSKIIPFYFLSLFLAYNALHEQLSCVRAQVESPQGRKPLGTRRQKSELVSSFCRF
jgi:hypothetical protein